MNRGGTSDTPGGPALVREQVLSVALAIRREVAWGIVAMCLLTVLVMIAVATSAAQQASGTIGTFVTDWEIVRRERLTIMSSVAMALGLFAPMGFWKDMGPSRRAYFWSLPVDRRTHSVARAAAGWLVLMSVFAGFFLWSVGGRPAGLIARDGQWWFWLVPFAAATAAYLLGTAVTLLSDRPWLWFGGGAVLCMMYMGLLNATWNPLLKAGLTTFMAGDYGAFRFASGYAPAIDPSLLDSFEGVAPYQSDPAVWAVTAALWTAPFLLLVYLSNRRFLDR